jgi:hypothetical protein
MSLTMKQPEGKDWVLPPVGPTLGICYQIIDLGTHKTTWEGQEKSQQKIRLTWELPSRLMEDGRPFVISREYTLSMAANANLRADVEAWLGVAMEDGEAWEFDIADMAGVAATISVVHNKSKDGTKTYANVGAIMPVMEGMPVPELVNDMTVFNLDHFTQEAFDKLPEFIQKKIKESQEWPNILAGQHGNSFEKDSGFMSGGLEKYSPGVEDDIPF